MTRLKHYGVKGMRWGVRRSEEELAEADGEGAGGGAMEEDEESLLEEMKEKMEELIDGMKDGILSSLDGVKNIGKDLMKKFKDATSAPIDPSKFKKAKPDYDFGKNPEAQKELDRYISTKWKIDKKYEDGKISKKEYKAQIKKNKETMQENVKQIERKEKGLSKTTIYVDSVKKVNYSIKGNAGLNSHVVESKSNR